MFLTDYVAGAVQTWMLGTNARLVLQLQPWTWKMCTMALWSTWPVVREARQISGPVWNQEETHTSSILTKPRPGFKIMWRDHFSLQICHHFVSLGGILSGRRTPARLRFHIDARKRNSLYINRLQSTSPDFMNCCKSNLKGFVLKLLDFWLWTIVIWSSATRCRAILAHSSRGCGDSVYPLGRREPRWQGPVGLPDKVTAARGRLRPLACVSLVCVREGGARQGGLPPLGWTVVRIKLTAQPRERTKHSYFVHISHIIAYVSYDAYIS